MLILYALLLFLVGAAGFVGAALLWYRAAAREYAEPRTILCPETLEPAEIRVDSNYAARTRFAGHEELRIAGCSRWPERAGCDQACAAQAPLVGDDRTRTQYAPGGLEPAFLRIQNPVRMTLSVYRALTAQLARQKAHLPAK